MSSLIEDVLAAWRDAERAFEQLPELHPDHEDVARTLATLRHLYADLTGASNQTRVRMRAASAALKQSQEVLARAHRAIEAGRTTATPPHDGPPAERRER